MDDDPRPDCRYGSLCYQKNPEHHAKFKHTFKRKERTSDEQSQSKKMKQSPKQRTSETGESSKKDTSKHGKVDTNKNTHQETPRNSVSPPSKTPNKNTKEENNSPSKTLDHLKHSNKEDGKDSNQKESKNVNSSMKKNVESSPKKRNSETKKIDTGEILSTKRNSDSELNNQEIASNRPDGGNNTIDSRESTSAVEFKAKCEARNSRSPKKRNSGSNSFNNSKMNNSKDLNDTVETNDSKLNTSGNLNINNVLIEDLAHLKSIVKEKYLVQMPEEFFTFWKLCQKISPRNPTDAFRSLDLKLVGPFDVMNGKVVDGPMVTHWRFFYDPPELQTIIVSTLKNQEQLHYGYFRDCPDEDPVFIASNTNKNCEINPVAANIFTFIYSKIEEKLKSKDSPQHTVSSLEQKLKDFAHSHKIDLETPKINSIVRARKLKTVCKGLSGVGIVVPYVKKTELGYRELQKTDKELENLFAQYKDPEVEAGGRQKLKSILQEVSTWVTIAIDESDFGTGLEFGLDLFGSGIEELHAMAKCTLGVAYQYLYREEFGTILDAHLANRKKSYVDLLEENQ